MSLYERLNYISKKLWDFLCAISIVGIWPRYIEPKLVKVVNLKIPIKNLPSDLYKVKILQISDLHVNNDTSARFLKRIAKKIKSLAPDIVVFTGDLLSCSKLYKKDLVKDFLRSISSQYGNFYIFGNHDYNNYVTVDYQGNMSVVSQDPSKFLLTKGLYKLITKNKYSPLRPHQLEAIEQNAPLVKLLKDCSFIPLENETHCLPIKSSFLNICGLGDLWAGRMNLAQGFQNYNPKYPGVVLVHNPDTIPLLDNYPGDLILSGHTHGGQVNFPWLNKIISNQKHLSFYKGFIQQNGKSLYINRGLGGQLNFRLFCPPEITLITLVGEI